MPRLDKLERFRGGFENNHSNNGKKNNSQTATLEKNAHDDLNLNLESYLRKPKYSLKDVVLSPQTEDMIRLVLAELKHSKLIYQDWGMAEKHKHDVAICMNLFGSPGTGKTLTAEAIAHELDLPILVISYPEISSKFMGETGKIIREIFSFAKHKNALLFFDEADVAFSQRIDAVGQSADSEVNLTRSVIIMELSEFSGIFIAATNKLGNYDSAINSRIRWQIEFTLPDEETRAKIWKAQIPNKLPLDSSVNFSELATQFSDISGRDIKKAVLQATVAAACEDKPDEDKCVTQFHFIEAMKQVVTANEAAEKEKNKANNQQFRPVTEDVELPSESSANLSVNDQEDENDKKLA